MLINLDKFEDLIDVRKGLSDVTHGGKKEPAVEKPKKQKVKENPMPPEPNSNYTLEGTKRFNFAQRTPGGTEFEPMRRIQESIIVPTFRERGNTVHGAGSFVGHPLAANAANDYYNAISGHLFNDERFKQLHGNKIQSQKVDFNGVPHLVIVPKGVKDGAPTIALNLYDGSLRRGSQFGKPLPVDYAEAKKYIAKQIGKTNLSQEEYDKKINGLANKMSSFRDWQTMTLLANSAMHHAGHMMNLADSEHIPDSVKTSRNPMPPGSPAGREYVLDDQAAENVNRRMFKDYYDVSDPYMQELSQRFGDSWEGTPHSNLHMLMSQHPRFHADLGTEGVGADVGPKSPPGAKSLMYDDSGHLRYSIKGPSATHHIMINPETGHIDVPDMGKLYYDYKHDKYIRDSVDHLNDWLVDYYHRLRKKHMNDAMNDTEEE